MIDLPPGMHFIERDWLSANHVLFIDGPPENRTATLVDSGYVKHASITVAMVTHLLAREGVQGLSRIINTHLHSDHCGGNAALARAFGARVDVPVAELAAVQAWDESALTFSGTGQRCERFSAQGVIAPGDHLELAGCRWDVLAAPGHDPHSLVLHCPQHQILISADALWGNGFGVIFPELSGQSGFDEQQAVLELIATLPVRLVIPGHGPMFTDVKPALERAFSRLRAYRDDPTRNARNALKVLVKYLLLDFERLSIAKVHAAAQSASIMVQAAAQTGLPLAGAIDRAIDELVAQQALAREGDELVNL
jgi:glyoxylase-like metal-dependent hydrolase (beta-lactamase superfamily II)